MAETWVQGYAGCDGSTYQWPVPGDMDRVAKLSRGSLAGVLSASRLYCKQLPIHDLSERAMGSGHMSLSTSKSKRIHQIRPSDLKEILTISWGLLALKGLSSSGYYWPGARDLLWIVDVWIHVWKHFPGGNPKRPDLGDIQKHLPLYIYGTCISYAFQSLKFWIVS